MARARHLYRVDLRRATVPSGPAELSLALRSPSRNDIPTLARLMLEAYRGTIDDEGEDLAGAESEVTSFFESRADAPIPEASIVGEDRAQMVTACLVAWWSETEAPLIAYLVTHPSRQRQGLGSRLLEHGMRRLIELGHEEAWAVITEGNTASEKAFQRHGFVRVDPDRE